MLELITEDSVLPPTFNPVVLLFKDEGDLAKHPLSFHPQRGVWHVRKYEKGRESEGSCRGGKAESFSANFIDKLQNSCYMSLTELIYCLESRKLHKNVKEQRLH